MKNPKFNLMAIAAVITGIIAGSGCKTTCYCPTPEVQEYNEIDTTWCCGDRLTKACMPDSDRFYSDTTIGDYGNCDIRIDTLWITRVGDDVVTDIYISNSNVGDDDASCARLEVLLPMETKFKEFKKLDDFTKNWELYDGYLRVNLGQLGRGPKIDPHTHLIVYPNHRHVQVITTVPCRPGINSGIAAFVYSMVPDPCLANNYAFGHYQTDRSILEQCIAPKVHSLVGE
ncbi:MAG TPA: hypothetical protein VJY62_15960 [Bacteroidia bacterium]|nr:hypothetical protein [Bacteroidia bacterium]